MLRLKKTFATLLCFMGIFISSNAHAGIPTIDVSAIVSAVVNAVQAYGQALQEFQKLQQQYSQMQQMEQIATGQRGFNELLTNPLVMNNLPSDFTAAVQNVRSSAAYAVERAKYPITNNPKLNAMYESAAAQKATMQDFSSVPLRRLPVPLLRNKDCRMRPTLLDVRKRLIHLLLTRWLLMLIT